MPISEREWREWRALRSLAAPGPQTVRTVYRCAFPALLDECDALTERVKVLEALLGRAIKYAREDRATTPRTTRLARVLREAESALTPPPDAKGSREVESWHLPREQAAQDGKHVVVIEEPTAPPPPESPPRADEPAKP